MELVGATAAAQAGLIHWRQLRALGAQGGTISQWTRRKYLIRVLPSVYAVGHTASSREAALWAAVLYAGPGAALSHGTAGHRLGIVDRPPPRIQVSTPRRIPSTSQIRVYGQRSVTRIVDRGLPVTTLAQTVLDIAASEEARVLRRALEQLDYRRALDLEALRTAGGSGRPGTMALRAALERHDPLGKWTNGDLERDFLPFLRWHRLPLPEFNRWLHGIKVDAHWPQYGHVVELDGGGNHATVAQMRRDRANELRLRSYGLTVSRYDWVQIHGPTGTEVAAELRERLRSPG